MHYDKHRIKRAFIIFALIAVSSFLFIPSSTPAFAFIGTTEESGFDPSFVTHSPQGPYRVTDDVINILQDLGLSSDKSGGISGLSGLANKVLQGVAGILSGNIDEALRGLGSILGVNLPSLGNILQKTLGGELKDILGGIDSVAGGTISSSSLGGGGLFVPVKDFVQIALQTDIRAIESAQLGLLQKLVVKEYNLDPAAYLASKTTIRAILAHTLNWINTGDDGNPFYISNAVEYFRGVERDTAEKFLTELHVLDVDRTVQRSIAQAESQNYNFARAIQPTVSNSERDAFMQNFNNGGWNMWLKMIQPQNNPYGQYLISADELERRKQEADLRKSQELAWGRGYKPDEVCLTLDIRGNCLYAETVTPGSLIESQMAEVFSSVIRQLEADDELSEVVSSLLTSMFAQILGGRETGLRGFSPAAIIAPQNEQASVNRTKAGLEDAIETLLGTEINYHVKKSASLIRMNDARVSLGTLFESATSTASDKQYATTTLATAVNPTMRQLALNIILATQLIEKIQLLLLELDGVNTAGGVALIADKYADLSSKAHSIAHVSEAQREFDEIDELTAEILQEVARRRDPLSSSP